MLTQQLPKVIPVTSLEPTGVKFEATNPTELGRILSLGGEPEYLRAMLDSLRPDDVLYDIGANVGLVALHAARRCRTVAFEPDPSFLSRLRRNLVLNPSIHLAIEPAALGDADGTTTLFTDGASGGSPSLVHRGEEDAVAVRVHRLDTLLANGELPAPTVLKLDIEGAEMLALQGAERMLGGPAAPRALCLELHHSFLPSFGSSSDEVLALVRDAGYDDVKYKAERADQQHLIVERT
jgi:FkbM family methyltransferase